MSQSSTPTSRDGDNPTEKVEDAEVVADDAKDDLEPGQPEPTAGGQDADAAQDSAEPAEPQDDSDQHGSDTHAEHDDHDDHHGSGFAAQALKLVLLVVVIFLLAAWLLPRAAPYLPSSIAKHLMPGQQLLDSRLAELNEQVGAQAAAAQEQLQTMQASVVALEQRLATAEAEAAEARAAAEAASTAAQSSAEVAETATIADDLVKQAEAAAGLAAETAETATTAATEAGKVASAATRDTAALSRRMTSFEAQVATISEQLGALQEGFAEASAQGGSAGSSGEGSPELAAAFSSLKARVDGLGDQLDGNRDQMAELATKEDVARFATQDDLRSARLALQAEIGAGFAVLPDPKTMVSVQDLDEVRTEVAGLAERVTTAEESAAAAAQGAEQAMTEVGGAIRDASLRAAVAALTSRLRNGVAYADPLEEVAALTGEPAPDALTKGAETGLATPASLLRGFGRVAQAAQAADIKANSDEGLLGQTSAKLRSVVAGRPKGEQVGDDTASILSRVEARLKDGSLAEALTEVDSLSAAAQGAITAWSDGLRARVAADDAAAAYLSAIGQTQG